MPPRGDELRLRDIKEAIDNIRRYTADSSDWLVARPNKTWDAVLWNFAVIGEAVKALSPEVQNLVPEGEWSEAARLRDAVIHRYFANDPSIIEETVARDLPALETVVDRLLDKLSDS